MITNYLFPFHYTYHNLVVCDFFGHPGVFGLPNAFAIFLCEHLLMNKDTEGEGDRDKTNNHGIS